MMGDMFVRVNRREITIPFFVVGVEEPFQRDWLLDIWLQFKDWKPGGKGR